MTPSLRITLSHEIRNVISRHLEEIGQYLSFAEPTHSQVSNRVLASLERLSDICQCPPGVASRELYEEACECHADLELFLRYMNQNPDADFEDTHVGQIWQQSEAWCQEAGLRFQTALSEVWDLINPVKPDSMKDLGNGFFEARWWKPVPMMDIEILYYTEGIRVQGQPYEPHQLPGGLAVRFSAIAESARS